MSQNRINALTQLREVSESNVKMINIENLHDFILSSEPLHPAYEYLSETHKCDILRTYFMYHYGGGYSDIKIPNGSWVQGFEEMEALPEKWINGYHETSSDAIAFRPAAHLWEGLPGNGAYIIRPKTEFVERWYNRQRAVLDEKLEQLREHPSTQPDCCIEYVPGTKYPLHWNELLGRIFHEEASKHTHRIIFSIPTPGFEYYR
jgi:hypothetical protein